MAKTREEINAARRARYVANLENSRSKARVRKKARYDRDSSKELASQKRYRERRKDVINSRRKADYAKNAETRKVKSRAYYAANKERAAAQAREYRKHNQAKRRMQRRCRAYGITVDDFRELWNLQAGRCALCFERLVDDENRKTHVDHDHGTGEVRGLLCAWCNSGLGWFRDNVHAMKRAIDYVELGRLTPISIFSNGNDGR